MASEAEVQVSETEVEESETVVQPMKLGGGLLKVPVATLSGLSLKGLSFQSVEYLVKVSVHNPYPVPIPVCDITYTLKSDGRAITSGKIEDPGSLKANDKTVLEVTVKVLHNALLSIVKDMAKDFDIDYELELGLIIDLPLFGNFTIPLSRKGEIKIPVLSNIFK